MKAAVEKVERKQGTSFSVIAYSNAYFAAPLHIHPEYELILIETGEGTSYVGDSVRRLAAGDFMLIGKNLPHLWLSSDEYYADKTTLISRSVYTQFGDDIFPSNMHDIPELGRIYALLTDAQKGVYFEGAGIDELKQYFRELVCAEGFEKINGLYRLLYRLATECDCIQLSSNEYVNRNDMSENQIINKVHIFINMNYQNTITLEDIASNVGMNPSALCRYYKRYTGRRMFEYLTELRISYAVKLLANRSINIGQIAYSCGYNSLSHFNHQFKNITNYTPTEYVKEVLRIK